MILLWFYYALLLWFFNLFCFVDSFPFSVPRISFWFHFDYIFLYYCHSSIFPLYWFVSLFVLSFQYFLLILCWFNSYSLPWFFDICCFVHSFRFSAPTISYWFYSFLFSWFLNLSAFISLFYFLFSIFYFHVSFITIPYQFCLCWFPWFFDLFVLILISTIVHNSQISDFRFHFISFPSFPIAIRWQYIRVQKVPTPTYLAQPVNCDSETIIVWKNINAWSFHADIVSGELLHGIGKK
jgi:hypothetical protein